jgi:hypothetical protein
MKITYDISIFTSDIRHAGTNANIYIVLFGEKGEANEVHLKNESNNFERGKCDRFRIETSDIGRLLKIRVRHDNKGDSPGWHLDRVEIVNTLTKEKYSSVCNRWFAVDKDDGEIARDLEVTYQDVVNELDKVCYEVIVFTGDERGAGTDADV